MCVINYMEMARVSGVPLNWLPPDEGAAGIIAAEKGMSVWQCTHV